MKKIFAKFLIITSVIFATLTSLQAAVDPTTAEINRIAATLMLEVGGEGVQDSQIKHAGAVINYMYNMAKQKKKNKNTIIYADILYHPNKYQGSVEKFAKIEPTAAKLKGQLAFKGEKWANQNWNRYVRIAQMVYYDKIIQTDEYKETVGAGATSFWSNDIMAKFKREKPKTTIVYNEKGKFKYYTHFFFNEYLGNPFYHGPNRYWGAGEKGDNTGDAPFIDYSESSNADDDAVDKAEACNLEHMQEIYMGDGEDSEDKYCWYCKIVLVLTNSYLQAAKDALGASIDLGKLILKLGFAIWLAYYILQQVSAMTPTTPGKMLQEILIMGFKVALAYVCVDNGLVIIRDYFINPIVGLGVDYGTALLDPIINVNG